MTRLDDEYDPAEHHELDHITEDVGEVHTPTHYGWICMCGEEGRHALYLTSQSAIQGHRRHQDQKAEER